jgi:hypothetical protein
MGIRTRGPDIKAGVSKFRADRAARAEAEAVVDRWNRRLATGRDNAAEREENERHIAHLRERDRERQERELKEGQEAIAREVAERNGRNGWPY